MELETAETCLSGVLDGILSMQEAEQCIVNRRVRGNKCGTSVISDVWTLALTYICMEDMCVCVCVQWMHVINVCFCPAERGSYTSGLNVYNKTHEAASI